MVIRKLSDYYQPSDEELEKIREISDEEIDFSDAPETDLEFWSKATKVSPNFNNKTEIKDQLYAVWNAAGYPRSLNYDDQGNWLGNK